MQVESIYKQGAVQLVHPLRFKPDNVKVLVTVQDEDLFTAPTTPRQKPQLLHQAASSYSARIDSILAPFQHLLQSHAGRAAMNYKAIWEDHLSDKYIGAHEKSDF